MNSSLIGNYGSFERKTEIVCGAIMQFMKYTVNADGNVIFRLLGKTVI